MTTLLLILVMLVTGQIEPVSPRSEPRAHASAPVPVGSIDSNAAIDSVNYTKRLGELTPTYRVGYFELAEEVAAEDRTMPGRLLARRLYVLAVHATSPSESANVGEAAANAQASSSPPVWLASSACLGLAALADSEQERRWLTALAGTLAPSGAIPIASQQTESAARDSAALQLATALGYVRAGEGRKAQKIFSLPAVSTLLSRYEGLLNPGGLGGSADRVRVLAERHVPCPQCRNRRYIKDADGLRLCPSCHGRPGPSLSDQELIGQLRLESLLLNGIQRSWAAQTVADGGAPMRELDPEILLDVYSVDARKAWWRNGEWTAAAEPQKPVDDGTAKSQIIPDP